MSKIFLDENSLYRESELNLNKIVIAGVQGVLKEPLKFSIESDWEPLFNLADRFQGTQMLVSLASGSRLFNTGIWSKRFWKGGSYLRINPSMRIVDSDGTGNVLRDCRILLDAGLPAHKREKGKTDAERIMNSINIKNLPKSATEAISKGVGAIGDAFDVLTQEGATALITKISEGITSNGPSPVSVSISNFFRAVFVIENIEVEFSKEMTKYGPLYADLNMTLGTQEITTKGNTGLISQNSTPKISRKNSTKVDNVPPQKKFRGKGASGNW